MKCEIEKVLFQVKNLLTNYFGHICCKNNEKRQKSVHSRKMHLFSIYVSGVHFDDKIINSIPLLRHLL